MKLKSIIVLLVSTLSLHFTYSQNIAYIHRDSILIQTPHYLERIREVENYRNLLDSNLKKETNELQQKANKLFSKYPSNKNEDFNALKAKLTPTDLLVLEELESTNKKIENKKIANQKLIEIEQSKKIVPLIDQINKAISTYAEKNKIDLIYIIEDLKEKIAYFNPAKNCTSEIIKSLVSKK